MTTYGMACDSQQTNSQCVTPGTGQERYIQTLVNWWDNFKSFYPWMEATLPYAIKTQLKARNGAC